jgi:hypothetical protein
MNTDGTADSRRARDGARDRAVPNGAHRGGDVRESRVVAYEEPRAPDECSERAE